MLFAVTVLLLPSRLQSPSWRPVETIAAPQTPLATKVASGGPIGRVQMGKNGAERNRTAVRNTGVDHLVGPKPDRWIMAPPSPQISEQRRWASPNLLRTPSATIASKVSGSCMTDPPGGVTMTDAIALRP